MRHIKTEIIISARPEKIWEVLMDFENYPNWNPFMRSIEGEQSEGGKLIVQVQPPDGKAMTFKPKILAIQADKELRWLGTAGIRGIFDGEHYFKLFKQTDGTTKFIHGEKFSGLLIGLMKKTLDKTEAGFKLMNQSLKEECEKAIVT